jgi:hypothetical protein
VSTSMTALIVLVGVLSVYAALIIPELLADYKLREMRRKEKLARVDLAEGLGVGDVDPRGVSLPYIFDTTVFEDVMPAELQKLHRQIVSASMIDPRYLHMNMTAPIIDWPWAKASQERDEAERNREIIAYFHGS